VADVIDPASTTSNDAILPSHIAETVDAIAQIHADHHLKAHRHGEIHG
jgi:hypothetical protein